MKSSWLVSSAVLVAASTAFGQGAPVPNPVPNSDGTRTFYTGDGMQWTTAQALDSSITGSAVAGDEIVIMAGTYTTAITCAIPNVTIRSNVVNDGAVAPGDAPCFGTVILRYPTTGPGTTANASVTVSANNVTIGRPNLITQLANGNISTTTLPYDASGDEFSASAILIPITQGSAAAGDGLSTAVAGSAYVGGDPNWTGGAGALKSSLQSGVDAMGNLTFQIQSREFNKSAIIANNCSSNFNYIQITTNSGSGGGIQCLGAGNNSTFNGCTIANTSTAGSNDGAGNPVYGIYVGGGAPMFNDCEITGNTGGLNGVVHLAAATNARFSGCSFGRSGAGNNSPSSNGIVTSLSGASFNGCTFEENVSRLGTIYFDSTGINDYLLVSGSSFILNQTANRTDGGSAYCEDAVSGRAPLIVFDRCEFRNIDLVAPINSGQIGASSAMPTTVRSTYIPRFRMGSDCTVGVMVAGATGAGVANAEGDDAPSGNPADVNGDGVVNGADLAYVLGQWD